MSALSDATAAFFRRPLPPVVAEQENRAPSRRFAVETGAYARCPWCGWMMRTGSNGWLAHSVRGEGREWCMYIDPRLP
jgi:hypothetical protein